MDLESMNRVQLLESMNFLVHATTEENLIESWYSVVPESATKEDFQEVAEDEELFELTVNQFEQIAKHFKSGLCMYGKWY